MMKTIDLQGQPCPIPVIEAKKALLDEETEGVLLKVDNFVAVLNLEKMAEGFRYIFSYEEISSTLYEVQISKQEFVKAEKEPVTEVSTAVTTAPATPKREGLAGRVVVISRDTMGEGAEELGRILMKSFIYSLVALDDVPEALIFLNSGAKLTNEASNTISDLKSLEQKGTEILTCGTCINYYELALPPAVGTVCDMYRIAEKMTLAGSVINI